MSRAVIVNSFQSRNRESFLFKPELIDLLEALPIGCFNLVIENLFFSRLDDIL